LYQRLVINGERISTDKALTEGPYHDFRKIFNSLYYLITKIMMINCPEKLTIADLKSAEDKLA